MNYFLKDKISSKIPVLTLENGTRVGLNLAMNRDNCRVFAPIRFIFEMLLSCSLFNIVNSRSDGAPESRNRESEAAAQRYAFRLSQMTISAQAISSLCVFATTISPQF